MRTPYPWLEYLKIADGDTRKDARFLPLAAMTDHTEREVQTTEKVAKERQMDGDQPQVGQLHREVQSRNEGLPKRGGNRRIYQSSKFLNRHEGRGCCSH